MTVRIFVFLVALALLPSAVYARGWLYEIDPVHTQVTFFVDHLGYSQSSGRAYGTQGHFVFEPGDWTKACVVAKLPTARISFGDPVWDQRMRRSDFFDAMAHSEIMFHSTTVEAIDEDRARVHGQLTVRGTGAPVILDLTFNQAGQNVAAGRYAAGFSARATLKRSDFGMTALLPRVGDEVNVIIEAEGWRLPRSPGQIPRCEPAQTGATAVETH